MNPFNSINFIKALKESYDAIPFFQGDQAAKVMVADAIKHYKFNPEEVLSFICSEMGNPSIELDKDGWKTVFKKAVKNGGLEGKCLEVCANVEKRKASHEDIFSAVMKHCGKNANYAKSELYLDMLGWQKAVETLVKTAVAEETVVSKEEEKEAAKVETKTEKKAKTRKPTAKMESRRKSITLINEVTGEEKTWPSYHACEKELYGEKKGHGVVSQLLNPTKGLKHLKGGWVLPKEDEKTPVGGKMRSKSKAVRQCGLDKDGHEVDKVWSSLSEASKATGIPYSSISKAVSGIYKNAGGYRWMVAEAA